MDNQGEAFESYEAYLKEHQASVDRLMNLEHVPRYIRLMELKAVLRALQKITIEVDTITNFLDRTHQNDQTG